MRAFVLSRLFTPEPPHRLGQGVAALAAAGLLLALGTAIAPIAAAQTADGSTGLDSSGNPKSERAACNSRKTAQARQTCLTEVRNAQAAKRAGKLQNYGDFSANALERCQVFKEPDDQTACRARVEQARIDGSVAEGGILREAQTQVSAPPDMMQGTGTRTDTGSGTGTGSTPGTDSGAGTGTHPGSGSGTMPMDTPPRTMPQQ